MLVAQRRATLIQDPGSAASQANLGLALKQAGEMVAAIGAYRRALLLAPDHAQIHNNLGSALHQSGAAEEASRHYRKAIALAPSIPSAYFNLANLMQEPAGFRHALRLESSHPDLHGGLAVLEQHNGRLDLAFPGYRRAIALQPERADFYTNLGNGLRQAGDLPLAETAYNRALTLSPGQSDASFNLGLLFLLTGRLADGWPGYELRWETEQLRKERRSFAAPLWRGEAGAGQTLLLHGEQGFGDTLQFCRYASLAKARGFQIILEVQPPLRRLLRPLSGCDQVIARGDPLPPFDFHCPLLSLPMLLGTDSLADIPAPGPYLQPDPAAVAVWASRFTGDGFKVGLAWAGAPRSDSPVQAAFDRRRSLPFSSLAPILATAGVRFYSLQKGVVAGPGLTDFMAEMTDFADTAALIANLDLVISVDTAVAHLAGAMGKPVWLLNRFDTDWRWLTEGVDTRWYPAMRIFRQKTGGDWAGVVEAVRKALAHPSSPGLTR